MIRRPLLLIGSLAAVALVIAACTRFNRPNLPQAPGGAPPTRTPTEAAAQPPTPEPTPTPESDRTPAPTLDFVSVLVTQAYQNFTPAPRSTEPPTTAPTMAAVSEVSYPTATLTLDPAPSSVIFGEPIQIANAVSTADCKIRNVGDCTPVMAAGRTLFFTWTFGVKGDGKFQWGQAAVLVTRDGETIQWTQAGNGLVRPPNFDKGEVWSLNVGQQAKFAAGLEKVEPGFYTARLMMCLLSMQACNEGQGWQPAGGEAINFVIAP